MIIIEIKALENGAHRNQAGCFSAIPAGWAVIPDGMVCKKFPFGKVETAAVDGIMVVTKWTPGEIPAEPEQTAESKRETAYNSEPAVVWDGKTLTVTEAAQLWQYYAAEGNEKAALLQERIAEAKRMIRDRFPDSEVTE